MKRAILFEIREFSLFDGPGIRTTVFLKGCPLRCVWCHNPEGQAFAPQLLYNARQCTHCGACEKVCVHEKCVACGACAKVCAFRARRLCGFEMDEKTLTEKLLRNADVFRQGGGVTFSGGEPLAQADFVHAVSARLKGHSVHVAIETSGYVSEENYRKGIALADLVFQDWKHPDPEAHRRYTGGDLEIVLKNMAILDESGKPFVIRVPLIPGVNDSPACMEAFAKKLENRPNLLRVEMLPYHLTAGAKYHLLGQTYRPPFDENAPLSVDISPFTQRKIDCHVL